jgi:hypothetical protein
VACMGLRMGRGSDGDGGAWDTVEVLRMDSF